MNLKVNHGAFVPGQTVNPGIQFNPFPVNENGGIKYDQSKVRPTLLLKSMPGAVQQVIDVLEYGARKYAPDNWKKVEYSRYEDALLRHVLAFMSGEKLDDESKKHHLAHAVCCALFMMELEKTELVSTKQT